MGKTIRRLVFAVNGERYELPEIDPSTTLLEFLRTRTPYKGAKLGCGEGGCGACVVLLSTYDPITEQVTEFSASSCLTLLCSINFHSVTTTEGIGNSKDGFHPIHQRVSGFHASQCGFCTPGMCMSLFSAVVNADKTDRPEPPNGFSKLTVSEAVKAISGNLCRCTGYRPIVDTCKSFAADVDLEDLGLNSFWKKGDKNVNVSRLPHYSSGGICTFPEFLKSEIKSISDVPGDAGLTATGGGYWYRPDSVEDLYKLLNSEAFSESSVKMVVGNTSTGVYKDQDLYDKYVDLRGIPELSVVKSDREGVEIGAAVTISRAIEVLKAENECTLHSNGKLVFNKIADHMNKVASPFVRNTASVGGNLIMAQRNPFASDIATILLAAGAILRIQMASERLSLTLEEFLERPPCDYKTLLLSVYIPCWSSACNSTLKEGNVDSIAATETNLLFETYRAAPRPLGNAVAYLNSAFLAHTSLDKESGSLVLDNLNLAFGAYGTDHAIRARKVENFLKGKPVTASILLEALKLLKETIVVKKGTAHPAYRSSLAVSFLFDFLRPFANGLAEPGKAVHIDGSSSASIAEYPSGKLNGRVDVLSNKTSKNMDIDFSDMILSSRQDVEIREENYPIGEPTQKVGAADQASGEAVYVDDIPSPKNCLYGAFIYSTRPLAHVRGIKFSSSLASQKIVTVVSVNDIPKGGENVGASFVFGSESLFAGSLTEYAGQPLGVVIAETQRHANMAAKQAIVDYGTENLEPPILSVEDAVERCSYFDVPSMFSPKQIGDFSKGMAEADQTILSAEVKLDSQYFFYMETQAALAVPDEDNCMVVYSSNQGPELTQSVIGRCLGIPSHNIRIITRRVGGGFGGKMFKASIVSTACALAAHKLRRPVRMYVDRKTDMIMAGGRHPMKVGYSVGFKSDGKIIALHLDLLINAGIAVDLSPLMPRSIIGALKKYNWGALSLDIKVCKTNLSSKTAMRAPGFVQGSFIAEAIIEHVASTLSLDTNSVRKRNLHTFESLALFYGDSVGEAPEYTLPSIFDKLALSPSYQQRVEVIRHFNSINKWKKRGISCVPIMYHVVPRPAAGKVSVLNDGSVVVEVGGIEIGQGLWTRVRQMAAFALGQLWDDGSEEFLERVRVIQADTLSLTQGGITAGSTTSQSSSEAVRLSCGILVDRLRPLKDRLQKQNGVVSWDSLITQANLESVHLSASAYWVPDLTSKYLNYGAAASEVELDLLTGAATILRTDLVYDCGQSLNPAVDLGQVEGAFVQGIGFFMYEEYLTNADGLVVTDGTWTYKIPTIDTIPKQFNIELLNKKHNQNRVLSSKASGEPPLLLAASVHCAIREAIRAARADLLSCGGSDNSPFTFQLEVPATMPVIKELCGLDNVEKYLEALSAH